MGKRLATLPDSTLERATRDPRLTDAAHRAAKHELERRARLEDHCPHGRGCTDFACTKVH
jgi:hypothetical protein